MLVFTFFMLLIWFEQIDLIDCLVFCCWICILRHRKPWKTQTFSPTPLFFFFFSFFFQFFFFFFSPLIIHLVAYLRLFSVCLPACSVLAPSLLPAFRTPQRHSHTRHRDAHTLHWGPIKPSRGNSATSWASTPPWAFALLGHPNHQPSICKLPSWFAISQTPLPDWGLGWTHCRQHHDLLPMLCIF